MNTTTILKSKISLQSLFSIFITNVFFILPIMTYSQKSNHGFKLIKKQFVKEVNADCYFYEHIKSGAQLFKIATTDQNKTFGIAFKTVPTSDNGVAHIMEHSVLNGSKKYPVKSPFDVLSKGSLKTFLNAMTSKDVTVFPFASMNDKDYFNLMSVYLDAVFNPLIYSDERILKQEGWHHELTSKDASVIYKGIVYNEMKGVFSNPTRDLSYHIYKNLYPDNVYGCESGGYPSSIPTLTQEEFLNFHRKFYHPENSYIILYGNADFDKELDFIDKEYLSKYSKTGSRAVINNQKAFSNMKDVKAFYNIMEGATTDKQTFLSLSYVCGDGSDYALQMALNIISEVLFNQESAPVRHALQQAGIGQDLNADVTNFKQNDFQIIAQNANATDKQKFLDIVINTLKETVQKGIDKKEIKGVLNRMEFQLREGSNAQKGLSLYRQLKQGWFFADNPFLGLEYEKTLATVKQALTSNYLEKIIQTYLIDNKHSLLLTLEPKPGLDKEKNIQQEQTLKTYKEKLNETDLTKLITESNSLIDFQKREDTPESLATIPLLKLSDINPKPEWYVCEEKQTDGVKTLYHDEFSNDIIYSDLLFDMNVLPKEMISYAALLSNMLGLLSTEKYSYGDLNQQLNINTGGFYTSINSYLENLDDDKLIAKFIVTSKVMKSETGKMFELADEILNHTKFSDVERLKSVLTRHQSQLDASMKRDGFSVASGRLPSYFSKRGMFNELTGGIDYYRFLSALTREFDKNSAQIIDNLKKTATLLFTRENMIATATCAKNDQDYFANGLSNFLKIIPTSNPIKNNWILVPEKKNEGILTASKVQYVIAGFNFKNLGYIWDGKMRVLNQIISTDWLKNQVRVIGGAYGGFSNISPNGWMTFNSYRDPNLKSTIENYNATPDYLSNFTADDNTMTRYILGTISGLDAPMTVQQRGSQAFTLYFAKRTEADLQKERTEIISTKAGDIKGFAKLIKDILDQKVVCVYGNSDKINSEKEYLKELMKIDIF